ncbi:MAG: aldehyde dehydrogenase family protein, partial [Myxococcota bacterium]
HQCGMPKQDADWIHCSGAGMNEVINRSCARSHQFTGSSTVAEHLAQSTAGKIFIEDAGFDWKILGPDASAEHLEYVAWQSDQDAYAASGQKCSAQSILFAHENWVNAGLFAQLQTLAARRSLQDLTVGPILTVNNEQLNQHRDALLKIPGAKLLFGGAPLAEHNIPHFYGAYEPTAIHVPLEHIHRSETFELVCTEMFAPFQVVTTWNDAQLPMLLDICERMEQHLTAAVVSNDAHFVQHILAHTVNGTTYAGLRARTTGAPQNHWFGPAGDPRSAGIGTPEAIRMVWSCHREIIRDIGPVPSAWTLPPSS